MLVWPMRWARAVACLPRGVPPRIEVDDRVGPGQVQAGTARFEADEKDRDLRRFWNRRTSPCRSTVAPSR